MTNWHRYVRRRLPPLDIRAEREAEIVDELAQQLESAYDTAIASGASSHDAHRRAEAEVPDWAQLAREVERIERHPPLYHRIETPPHHERSRMMNGIVQDLSRAVRGLVHSPAYTIVAAGTLALGLALGTATFALVDGILLRPLPYHDADRLVLVKATVPPEGRETVEITYPDAVDLAKQSTVIDALAAVVPLSGTTTMTDPPTRLEGFGVSTHFFATLALEPALGRLFGPEHGDPAHEAVAVIGHAFWQRLGSPQNIVGQSLVINEAARTIIGVAPRGFRVELFPGLPADVFLPLTAASNPFAENRGVRVFRVIARLKTGVSIDQANALLQTVGAQLATAYPDTNAGRRFRAVPLQAEIVGEVRAQLWLIAGLVTIVLLVATVNHVGLVLARASSRMRDLMVRIALGASRWRLVRESIAEGMWLSMIGAIAGGLLAGLALQLVAIAPGIHLPRLAEIAVDWRALVMLALTAGLVTCLTSVAPLAIVRSLRATAPLRTGHETAGRPALRLRGALIVGQTAFAFVLMAAAGLLAHSLVTLLRQPLGFDTTHVVTMSVAVPETRYPSRTNTTTFYGELLDTLRRQPTVAAAGLVSTLPLSGSMGSTLTVQGRDNVPLATRPTIGWQWASPGYFAALGIPLLRGRDFLDADLARTAHVTVVNETFANLHFPGDDPIGKLVYFGGYQGASPPEWHEIIGIVADVRHRSLDSEPDARAYDLFGQHWGRTISLAVRSAESPLHVAGLVRQLLAQRDPRLAVFSIRTTEDLVSNAVATRRFLLWLVMAFALIGLAIALAGLYATLSYVVSQRRRELGVRLALGASSTHVRGLVVKRGMALVLAGLSIGLIATIALRGAIDSQLVGITTLNAPALSAAATALLAAALIACLVPASRAVRVNPVETLRAE